MRSKNGRCVSTLGTQRELLLEFLKLLAVTHECMAERVMKDGEEVIFYQGPSPDEVTLVDFARQHGVKFKES